MVLQKKDDSAFSTAAAFLRSGKLTVLPTDTIYGFSTIDTDEGARLIQKAKGRAAEKAFIRLVASPEEAGRFSPVEINPRLTALWPGAVTVIVPTRDGKTMAFRCPDDEWLRTLIHETGRPVFSTSVNLSGEPPLTSAAGIERTFGRLVDLIVADDDAVSNRSGIPSTIVDASVRPYRILRQGAVRIPPSCLNF